MKTYKTLTSEARIVLALIVASIALFDWAIYVNAQRSDAVGALVLSLTVSALGALGAYIVTCELRDNNALNSRNRLHRLHFAQVCELSNAIAKLERDNARPNLSLDIATQNENGLLNLVRLACLYAIENAHIGAIDEYQGERYEQMTSDLDAFAIIDNGELTNDRLAWYAQAFHNGECVSLGDIVKRDELLERARYAINGGDLVEQVATYTYSATDALIFGTLDKAYTITNEYGRETVYPLA